MALKMDNLENIRKITLRDLVNDAVERGNREALEWLKKESEKTTTRKHKDGSEYEISKSITEIRAEYLVKYCGYRPKTTNKSKDKKKKEREKMFADAFAALDKHSV